MKYIVIENNGVAERLGLDPKTIRALNPDIVYLSAPGYGVDGPCGRRPAFAPTIGAAAGLAGGLATFAKGSVFPGSLATFRSVDALAMVLLGGVQSMAGAVVGALIYTGLFDTLLLASDYWRAMLGAVLLGLILWRPQGLVR